MKTLLQTLPTVELSGAHPSQIILCGEGINREELKNRYLNEGFTLSEWAITTPLEIAKKITSHTEPDLKTGVSSFSRQLFFKELLKGSKTRAYFPLCEERLKNPKFLSSLEKTLTTEWRSFSSFLEEQIMSERLSEKDIPERELRSELLKLTAAYRALTASYRICDEFFLFEKVALELEKPDATDWLHLVLPVEKITFLALERESAPLKFFLDRLKSFFSFERVEIESRFQKKKNAEDLPLQQVTEEKSHTPDDAAFCLAEKLSKLSGLSELSNHLILIPDRTQVRRSLMRALHLFSIPVADERDPNSFLRNEAIRKAALPMGLFLNRFKKKTVEEWITCHPNFSEKEKTAFFKVLFDQAFDEGLRSLLAISPPELKNELLRLTSQFSRKETVQSCAQKLLKEAEFFSGEGAFHLLKIFKEVNSHFESVKGTEYKAYPLYWFSVFEMARKLKKGEPESLHFKEGVQIFRASEYSFLFEERLFTEVHVFGLQEDDLSTSAATLWFSERAKEVLSLDFEIESRTQKDERKKGIFLHSLSVAPTVSWYSSIYDSNGKEAETNEAFFRKLGIQAGSREMVSISPWVSSFEKKFNFDKPFVRVDLANQDRLTLTASAFDQYSKCAFLYLAKTRWNAVESRETAYEPWPDVYGNFLHKAVEKLIKEKISVEESVFEAWKETRKRGLLASEPVEKVLLSRAKRILESFILDEVEYRKRSQTEVFQVESESLLTYESDGVEIRGRADRIDLHDDGLFVVDYKTGSNLATGKEMIEQGRALQLPFYMLAVEKKYDKPVIGAQFIELRPGGKRNKGVFLSRYNGKKVEKALTTTTAANSSLFKEEREAVLVRLKEKIDQTIADLKAGIFDPIPKNEKECRTCDFNDLCGKTRRLEALEEEE